MDLFARSWTDLLGAVGTLSDADFERPSGCDGWLVRDLVCHLVIDAQDVLITLVTPSDSKTTVDATSYWTIGGAPTADDPLAALIPRLAAAYRDPALLRFHLEDVGAAAGRAARLADPGLHVGTQGEVLTVADYLSAYVLEWTVHHLDLIAHLPWAVPPSADAIAASRSAVELIAGHEFPVGFTDTDVLLVGTGRRDPTDTELTALGDVAKELPLTLG